MIVPARREAASIVRTSVMDELVARVVRVRRQVIAFEVVRMQMRAARDRFGHVADHCAVAQHLVVFREFMARHLVTEVDGFGERHALAFDLDLRARVEPRRRDQAVVGGAEQDQAWVGCAMDGWSNEFSVMRAH